MDVAQKLKTTSFVVLSLLYISTVFKGDGNTSFFKHDFSQKNNITNLLCA